MTTQEAELIPLRRVKRLVGGLALLFVLVWFAPPLRPLHAIEIMPIWLHTLMEGFGMAIAAMTFGIVWNAHAQERSSNLVILACAFLATGLIDLAHTLSYRGMPDFITPSGAEKGINFWLAARLTLALALLVVAWRPWRPFVSVRTPRLLLAGALALTATVWWLGLLHQDIWPRTFTAEQGLTRFKIGTEYAIVALMAVAAFIFHVRRKEIPEANSLMLATIITILSELCFTLYSNVTDLMNLLGHVYKVIAYYFFYRAVFVYCVREPFLALQAAQDAIGKLNETLEYRVVERTRQLQEANRELEAFSYSVSHDLRAPLRSIEGFSQVLLRRHAGQLDDTGRDYLGRVCRASQRMGELIDDLLNLSRVTRTALRRQEIDLSALAASLVREMQRQSPERQVDIRIQDGMRGFGDPGLLRAALENLLGNAWKFTRHTGHAAIEFGCQSGDDELVYFVRDNGAGFDANYTNKLFKVFQRLHSDDEFEGTGIGLATVQRIIQRHHGRIWAEGATGQGATFRFTLPQRTAERDEDAESAPPQNEQEHTP